MSKIVFKYSKEGESVYLGHLELAKIFERAFRRAHIMIRYTEGFNPTPKMSFASPLSVGISSIYELGLVETSQDVLPESLDRIDLPLGIEILNAKYYNHSKSLMARMEYAEYIIKFNFDLSQAFEEFKTLEYLEWVKTTKRAKRTLNMMPYIKEIKIEGWGEIRAKLISGNSGSLNPNVFAEAFASFADNPAGSEKILIKRTGLYDSLNKLLF